MDDLLSSLKISAAGMKVQGSRLRVIAENLANAASLPTGPGESPYRRKNIIFQNVLNRELGLNLVEVKKVGVDRSEFNSRFDPNRNHRNTLLLTLAISIGGFTSDPTAHMGSVRLYK